MTLEHCGRLSQAKQGVVAPRSLGSKLYSILIRTMVAGRWYSDSQDLIEQSHVSSAGSGWEPHFAQNNDI